MGNIKKILKLAQAANIGYIDSIVLSPLIADALDYAIDNGNDGIDDDNDNDDEFEPLKYLWDTKYNKIYQDLDTFLWHPVYNGDIVENDKGYLWKLYMLEDPDKVYPINKISIQIKILVLNHYLQLIDDFRQNGMIQAFDGIHERIHKYQIIYDNICLPDMQAYNILA